MSFFSFNNSTIAKRFIAASCFIVILTSILSYWLLTNSYNNYNKAKDDKFYFNELYHLALVLNKLSAERAYANELMFATTQNKGHAKEIFLNSISMTNAAYKGIPSKYLSSQLIKKSIAMQLISRKEVLRYASEGEHDAAGAQSIINDMMHATDIYHEELEHVLNNLIKVKRVHLGVAFRIQALCELRDATGRLGSIMLLPLYKGERLSSEISKEVEQLKQNIKIQWKLLEVPGVSLEDSYYLLRFRKEAQRKFKRDGLSLINAIQEKSNHNEPYEMEVEYFAHHYRSSIYRFNDLLQLQFQQLNQQYSSIKKHALMRFLFVTLTLILVYLLAIYIVFYVSFKIVTPLANIVGKIKSFNNDTSCFSDENNEINELQKSLVKLGGSITEIKSEHKKLKELAEQDALTKLLNRRGFEAEAKTLLSCASVDSSVWIIALDIDHFKKINDTWGHSVGDEVLIKIGQTLLTGTREGTLAARLGGEEFVIMVKTKNTQSINQLAFRLQKKIRNLRFHTNGESFQITASFGIARCGDRSLEEALKAADTALYNSKNAGRDCISGLI